MAEHYTQVAFEVVLPRRLAHDIMQGIELLNEYGGEAYPNTQAIPRNVWDAITSTTSLHLFSALVNIMSKNAECVTGCTAKVQDTGKDDDRERLVVYAPDMHASVEPLVELIRTLLFLHGSTEVVGFEWANTATKPQPGSVGGGFVAISGKHGVAWGDSSRALSQATRMLLGKIAHADCGMQNIPKVKTFGERFGGSPRLMQHVEKMGNEITVTTEQLEAGDE